MNLPWIRTGARKPWLSYTLLIVDDILLGEFEHKTMSQCPKSSSEVKGFWSQMNLSNTSLYRKRIVREIKSLARSNARNAFITFHNLMQFCECGDFPSLVLHFVLSSLELLPCLMLEMNLVQYLRKNPCKWNCRSFFADFSGLWSPWVTIAGEGLFLKKNIYAHAIVC